VDALTNLEGKLLMSKTKDQESTAEAIEELERSAYRVDRRAIEIAKLYFQFYKLEEIASRLGVSLSTVTRSIRRLGLKRMRDERISKRDLFRAAREINKARDREMAAADADARAGIQSDERGRFTEVEVWQNGRPWGDEHFGVMPSMDRSVVEARDPATGALRLRRYLPDSAAEHGAVLDHIEPLLSVDADEQDDDQSD